MRYLPDFLCAAEARALFDWALDGNVVQWRRERFNIYGRDVLAPRFLCWFGDTGVNYRYTGLDHVAEGWPGPLDSLASKVAEASGCRFNFLLINRYDHGAHHMGWHRDDERGAAPLIASLSVGARRRFRYRAGPAQRSQALELENGSLLVFDGRVQHTLTKSKRTVGPRLNFTFRRVGACA